MFLVHVDVCDFAGTMLKNSCANKFDFLFYNFRSFSAALCQVHYNLKPVDLTYSNI